MRLMDLFGLALSALWQQKARTLLTTLGVVFGSFVLAASLSVGQGVQQVIEHESQRSDRLRRVEVRPRWGMNETESAAQDVQVRGEMEEAKRERIRKALVRSRVSFVTDAPRTALTRERLRALADLEHVDAVLPVVWAGGWATFDGHTETMVAQSTIPATPALQQRISAGRFLNAPDERAAIVSELLLYRCGIRNDAQVSEVIGKTLRLEFRSPARGVGLSFSLFKPGGTELTPQEALALEKVKNQLPATLDKFNLSAGELAALREATRALPPRPVQPITMEIPIAGVVRLVSDDESFRDQNSADVFLPAQLAEDIALRSSEQKERGLDQATLFVDREANVQGVLDEVRALGLQAFASIEFIQRERLMFELIFGGMTCVAAVALLVAALGIANTMLMSVLERTREVGIMKAVGAGNGHVQLIFLIEGALIGLFGGILGLLLGRAAAIPGDAWVRSMVSRDLKFDLKESLFIFPSWLVFTVIGVAAVVTTLAAVYPARRAAKVNPVLALRHE